MALKPLSIRILICEIIDMIPKNRLKLQQLLDEPNTNQPMEFMGSLVVLGLPRAVLFQQKQCDFPHPKKLYIEYRCEFDRNTSK